MNIYSRHQMILMHVHYLFRMCSAVWSTLIVKCFRTKHIQSMMVSSRTLAEYRRFYLNFSNCFYSSNQKFIKRIRHYVQLCYAILPIAFCNILWRSVWAMQKKKKNNDGKKETIRKEKAKSKQESVKKTHTFPGCYVSHQRRHHRPLNQIWA